MIHYSVNIFHNNTLAITALKLNILLLDLKLFLFRRRRTTKRRKPLKVSRYPNDFLEINYLLLLT